MGLIVLCLLLQIRKDGQGAVHALAVGVGDDDGAEGIGGLGKSLCVAEVGCFREEQGGIRGAHLPIGLQGDVVQAGKGDHILVPVPLTHLFNGVLGHLHHDVGLFGILIPPRVAHAEGKQTLTALDLAGDQYLGLEGGITDGRLHKTHALLVPCGVDRAVGVLLVDVYAVLEYTRGGGDCLGGGDHAADAAGVTVVCGHDLLNPLGQVGRAGEEVAVSDTAAEVEQGIVEAVQLTATREAGLAPIVKVSFGDPPALARDGKVGHGTLFPQVRQGLEGGDGIAVHSVDG